MLHAYDADCGACPLSLLFAIARMYLCTAHHRTRLSLRGPMVIAKELWQKSEWSESQRESRIRE